MGYSYVHQPFKRILVQEIQKGVQDLVNSVADSLKKVERGLQSTGAVELVAQDVVDEETKQS